MATQAHNHGFEQEMRGRSFELSCVLDNRKDLTPATSDLLNQLIGEVDCLIAVAGNRTEMLLSFAGFKKLVERISSHLETAPKNDCIIGTQMLEEATTIATLYQARMPARRVDISKPVRPSVGYTDGHPRMTFTQIVDELMQLIYS